MNLDESNDVRLIANMLADTKGVERFAVAMTAKLAKKRAEGAGGWNRPHECSMERLQKLLAASVAKGDPVDIANFAMMIWNRENPCGVSFAVHTKGELRLNAEKDYIPDWRKK